MLSSVWSVWRPWLPCFACFLFLNLQCVKSVLNCQGTTYANALANCPDNGAQQMSSGGNVTVKVLYATNMPNYDSTGPSAGVSDPYVRFKAGSVIRQTKNIKNNLNPTWNEDVNLGVLGSATLVTVEIWDRDGGLEFSDDLMLTGSFRVPFCSYFNSNSSTKTCDSPFNCYSEDSLWQMPTRKLCDYSGLINFDTKHTCSSSKGVCLHFEVYVVPFIMNVELTYSSANLVTPQLSVAASPVASKSWTSTYGFPYLGSTVSIDSSSTSSALRGALMLRTSRSDSSFGASGAIKFYASTNFPATLYICRFIDDNTNGVPSWITSEYSAEYLFARQVVIAFTGQRFQCYQKEVSGTSKNRWGGVTSGAVPMRTNTLPGHDTNSDPTFYSFNYIVLSTPYTVASRVDKVTIEYESPQFLDFLGSYGLITLWFIYLTFRFLSKIDYRIDRLTSYAVSRVLTGDDRNLIASLFIDFNKSPANVEYRAHLFHVRNILAFLITAPLWMVLSWGLCVSFKVRPRILGIGVSFGGIAVLLAAFGYQLWKRSNWRLSLIAATALLGGVLVHSLFLLIGLFVDQGVLEFDYKLDITGLSLIFGTLNCLPNLLLVFKHDRSHKVYMSLIVEKFKNSLFTEVNQRNAANKSDLNPELQVNKILHAVLGESYSINPNIPALRFGAVLQEIEDSFHNVSSVEKAPDEPSQEVNELEQVQMQLLSEERRLYFSSLFILFIYLIIAAARSSSGSLAFLNVCALILLDGIHLSMSKGESSWSPGFKVLMLVIGRVLICGSPESIWILNYSACYLFYAVTLIYEVINIVLPKLSERSAGQIVFGGEFQQSINEMLQTKDISGNPSFCFLALTVCFSAILIISIYLPASGALVVPTLTILSMEGWKVYVFGLIALFAAVVIGLLLATQRALQLDSHGLLKGWAKDAYIFHQSIRLPLILAVASELSILLSGLAIYAITDAVAILIGCIFLPAILFCMGRALKVWLENDFELVSWPRKPPKYFHGAETIDPSQTLDGNGKSAGGDLDTAYNMIDAVFGSTDNNRGKDKTLDISDVEPFHDDTVAYGVPESTAELQNSGELDNEHRIEKTLKGFTLPPLKVENKGEREIKMPPLPLKSVLRRKRQNLGIKTQTLVPVVQDLRVRESAPMPDQFGNRQEVLNIDDPWAQFELQETQSLIKKKKKVVMKEEISFLRRVNIYIRQNKTIQRIRRVLSDCFSQIQRKIKVYPSIYKPDFDGNDDEEEDDDEDELDDEIEDDGEGTTNKRRKRKKVHGDNEVLDEADIQKLPFWDAFWGGYLTNDEYAAVWNFWGGMLLIMFFGIAIAKNVQPGYLGYVIWIACWQFLLVLIPIVKYFNVYKFDSESMRMFRYCALIHLLFCISFFASYLNGSIQLVGSLWIMDFFFYFPIITYIVFLTVQWIDNGFHPLVDPTATVKARASGEGGGMTWAEFVTHLKSFSSLMAAMILLNWHFYTWINYIAGICFTLVLLCCGFAYYYLKDWADNDYFLSPELAVLGKYMMLFAMFISFCVALFRPSNPTFAWSVFFFIWAARYILRVLARVMILKRGTYFFFSPYLMPVYSYNAAAKDLNDESELVANFVMIFALGMAWGSAMTIFFYPLHIGIAISCGFLILLCSISALCVSYVPRQLAKVNALILPEHVKSAAEIAKMKFYDRRLPLNLEMSNYETSVPEDVLQQNPPAKTLLEKLKERTCLENSVALMADMRFMKYVEVDKEKEAAEARQRELEEAEKDVVELPWYRQLIVNAKDYARDLWELLPINKQTGWKKHNQAPFTTKDGCLEVFFRGRGPFGLFGMEGSLYSFLIRFKESQNCVCLYPKWTENYSPLGVDTRLVDIADPIDYPGILSRVRDLDRAIDHTFQEEARSAIHFLMMILVSADAKLEREKVLFQKFLRENRYRLASNGISPPKVCRSIINGHRLALNSPLLLTSLCRIFSLVRPSRASTFR